MSQQGGSFGQVQGRIHPTVMNMKNLIDTLTDTNQREDMKLKTLQEISENFEIIITTPHYPAIVESLVRIFIKLLQDTVPQFIGENNTQQLRKQMLELIHRIPCNEHLKQYSKNISALLFKLIQIENEENVLVCLRILIEIHKQFRPPWSQEIEGFLMFVKAIYSSLPNHMAKIFENREPIKVRDIQDVNVPEVLESTFCVTLLHTDQRMPDGATAVFTLLPRGHLSLKVLAELPISVVLFYQLYKQNVQKDLADFIPLILNTIVLGPSSSINDVPRDVLTDFVSAQVKTLSFLAYVARLFQDNVALLVHLLVQGILRLLSNCPPEATLLRKELLIAMRHILMTDLRQKFLPYISPNGLLDEKLLVGVGFSAQETLRPLAFSTLGDLVHHVRYQLPQASLTAAIYLFSRNAHDPSLPCSIQTMSCKLLLNLVEPLCKVDSPSIHELLLQMLDVFLRKFKIVAKEQLPLIFEKCEAPSASAAVEQDAGMQGPIDNSLQPSAADETQTSTLGEGESSGEVDSSDGKVGDKDDKYTSASANAQHVMHVNDCRGLVKTLVCGVKTITWGLSAKQASASAAAAADGSYPASKSFSPRESNLFRRLVKYGLVSLGVYTIVPGSAPHVYQRSSNRDAVRTKDEKEVLEHFAGLYALLYIQNFKEIFVSSIDYLVARINENYALQVIPNAFLANNATSSAFASILLQYLLERMDDMGNCMERSNLYLRLFKLVFSSVGLFPQENENMLRPHLHTLVNRSMELALTAKEPYNYFLLLRALFRSIGGGSHDLLYQEFLPLLPTLLQGLNSLQGGQHRQQMKELFVELCLTVPVRLSSLLPYLPMLMDPLVSALNGSPTLVSQGLRTLELCVDNLQPDFLFEHIAPVRASLMQALWKTVNSANEQTATVAFRILGKFGGSNRKMLTEPQAISFEECATPDAALNLKYAGNSDVVELPLHKAIEIALLFLKGQAPPSAAIPVPASAMLNPLVSQPALNLCGVVYPPEHKFHRQQSWQLVESFLIATLQLGGSRGCDLENLFSADKFADVEIAPATQAPYTFKNDRARATVVNAFIAAFFAVTSKELRPQIHSCFTALVRHVTLLAIAQQAGPNVVKELQAYKLDCIDCNVLIDALTHVMGHEDKELCKAAIVSMSVILDVCTAVLRSQDRACQLPFIRSLCTGVCNLCYQQAWYSKLGGCIGIKFFLEKFSPNTSLQLAPQFVKALVFILVDLVGEVSSGCLDMAQSCLELLIDNLSERSATGGDKDDTLALREQITWLLGEELVHHIALPNRCVREKVISLLERVASGKGLQLSEFLYRYRTIIEDIVLPQRYSLKSLSLPAQIGVAEALAHVLLLTPSLLEFNSDNPRHKAVFEELCAICESDESYLVKVSCYRVYSVKEISRLRISVIRALAACQGAKDCQQRIFWMLFRCLTSSNRELQEATLVPLREFVGQVQMDTQVVHDAMRPLLLQLGDVKSMNIDVVRKLCCLARVFPSSFNDRFCDQLLAMLKKSFEYAVLVQPPVKERYLTNEMEACTLILEIFHQLPAATSKFVENLVPLVARSEQALCIESDMWRRPLLKYLAEYPEDAVQFFQLEANLLDECICNLLLWMLRQEAGAPFRRCMQANHEAILSMIDGSVLTGNVVHTQLLTTGGSQKDHVEWLGCTITAILAKRDPTWLLQKPALLQHVHRLWLSPEFVAKHCQDGLDKLRWKTPRAVVKSLLIYFKSNRHEIRLLFDLLHALTERFWCSFQFLKDFLLKDVAQDYDPQWKRLAFLQFVEYYNDRSVEQNSKAKAVQFVLLPCLQACVESRQLDEVLGPLPPPDQESEENLVSVFARRVINLEIIPVAEMTDSLRIVLSQLSCLFVESAAAHIHDTSSKKQSLRLRQFMVFAWPCLQTSVHIDPTTRFNGHLLIAHIISKFAINRKIVIQVFHSLLKAHGQEARAVVQQALWTITPAVPVRMEDGHAQLVQLARKLFVEEAHAPQQLAHLLHLIIRHYKVYYPVRHQIMQYLISTMQRLGFTQQATNMENRRLALDLAETVVKWEMFAMKGDQEPNEMTSTGEESKPMEKLHSDAVVNFLIRFAVQVSEQQVQPTAPGAPGAPAGGAPVAGAPAATPSPTVASGDNMAKRCLQLLKVVLKPDFWGKTADLKLAWMDKVLCAAEQAQSFSPICSAIDVFTFLLGAMPPEHALNSVKIMQQGISRCLTCTNVKLVKSLYGLLTKVAEVFKGENLSLDTLDNLSNNMVKAVHEGLMNYEKMTSPTGPSPPATLFPCLTVLKVLNISGINYLDRMLVPYMKVLQKLTRDYLVASGEASQTCAEMIAMCLELLSTKLDSLNTEMKKHLIASVLSVLIEKSTSTKVMSEVVKVVQHWTTQPEQWGSPLTGISAKDKHTLLLKLQVCMERRFKDDAELTRQYLDLVYFIYQQPHYRNTDLTAKLEPSFMLALQSSLPEIRAKFFQLYDESVERQPYERLFYIICTQNWEGMGMHFWVKQCVELMLALVEPTSSLTLANGVAFTPLRTETDTAMDSSTVDVDTLAHDVSDVQLNSSRQLSRDEEVLEMESSQNSSAAEDLGVRFLRIMAKQRRFLMWAGGLKVNALLNALCNMCHLSVELAENVWVALLSRTWAILSDKQRESLNKEVNLFLASGSHVSQRSCMPSTLRAFLDAFSQCRPALHIKPFLLNYLGKSHSLWHRAVFMLENTMAVENVGAQEQAEVAADHRQELLESLADLYQSLNEEDMWANLWVKRAKYADTVTALSYEQMGVYEKAVLAYEKAMGRMQQDVEHGEVSLSTMREFKLWEERWARCCANLNQWDTLKDFVTSKTISHPFLVLDAAWHVPAWTQMKEALSHVETSCPVNYQWKLHLYRGFVAVCHPTEQPHSFADKCAEQASLCAIKDWKRLPDIVSHAHIPVLQAAQQVMELHEAAQIAFGLLPNNVTRANTLHDMRAIVKTWKNRLPAVWDSLAHWSDVFAWRQHHYHNMISGFENQPAGDPQQAQNSLLGIHASAQGSVQVAKTARKHQALSVAYEALSRLHTIPNLPVVDGYQKIRQHVKCCMRSAAPLATGKADTSSELAEALTVIDGVAIGYLNKDCCADLYTLRGTAFSMLGRNEEANQSFSAALQLQDGLVKCWAAWGTHCEGVFMKERQISLAQQAVVAFLQASRQQLEPKVRKLLGRVLWLLKFDESRSGPVHSAFIKHGLTLPPLTWLVWTPQLFAHAEQFESGAVSTLLAAIGRAFPQPVYYQLRVRRQTIDFHASTDGVYSRLESASPAQPPSTAPGSSTPNAGAAESASMEFGMGESKGTADNTTGASNTGPQQQPIDDADWSSLMASIYRSIKDTNPVSVEALRRIAAELEALSEHWSEKLLRELRAVLQDCRALMFEKRHELQTAVLPSTLKARLSDIVLALNDYKDVPPKLQEKLMSQFELVAAQNQKLMKTHLSLLQWVKTMQAKASTLPKTDVMQERSRYLIQFCTKLADIELPGELLVPKLLPYCIKIARFYPEVDTLQRNGGTVRRVCMRGHNGKKYFYMLERVEDRRQAHREDQVAQLFRLLNPCLQKCKESARRLLVYHSMPSVMVGPTLRLTGDAPSAVTAFELLKQCCAKNGAPGMTPDDLAKWYYEKLEKSPVIAGSAPSQAILRDIMKEVQSAVPRHFLHDWAIKSYTGATEYFVFRKEVCLHLALLGISEYLLYLSRLNSEQMVLLRDSGFLYSTNQFMDIADATGELTSNRVVPFRLTPCLEHMLGPCVWGQLQPCMTATARAFLQCAPNISQYLRPLLHYEFWSLNDGASRDQLCQAVQKTTAAILARAQNMATFDNAESKVQALIATAVNTDNLCRMDPAWHPWF